MGPHLPPELLRQFLLAVITNSVHSIGTSRGTMWDIQVFTTLAKVSPLFDDVVYDLVGRVFGLIDKGGERTIINEAEKLMHEFHQLSEPEEWPKIASAYPQQYPTYIFNAYALLSCAICLRREAMDSSEFAFLGTQDGAKTALRQASITHLRIATPEIASALYTRIMQEGELLNGSVALVRRCMEMNALIDRLPTIRAPVGAVSGDEEAVYVQLSQLLHAVDKAAVEYDREIKLVETPQPRAIQLPGVERTMRRVFCILGSKNLPLRELRIQGLVSRWENEYPFLSDTSVEYAVTASR